MRIASQRSDIVVWDVLYAVDASSSMSEPLRGWTSHSKISAVALAITEAIKAGAFPVGTRVGVITFSAATRAMGLLLSGEQDMTRLVVPLTNAEELTKNPEVLGVQLGAIHVGGATPTGTAIEKGVQILHGDQSALKRIKRLILVTDERSNVGPKPEKVLDKNLAKLVIVDIVGIGGKMNREILEQAAQRTGGRFAQVSTETELKEALTPAIKISELKADAPLIDEARKVAAELASKHDTNTLEFKQLLEHARETRAKLNKRLVEVLMLKSSSSSKVNEFASKLAEGPERKGISMKEYAEKVWPVASELPQLEATEANLRKAMDAIAF